jgi:mannose-1-phosphate guanylyltransferase
MKNYAIIMAGGVGTRFWPKGTSKLPKQFLKVAHDSDSMIQQSFKRLDGLVDISRIFIVTSIKQKDLVRKQLPQIHEENILCEPFGKNTAPCIGLACLFIKQFDPKGNVFVLPSDHIIEDVKEFQRVVNSGLKYVSENGGIVTLGLTPTKPETGYGYIQYDILNMTDVCLKNLEGEEVHEKIFKVKTFAEKPNLELAKAFIDSGDFLWNSGMFIFRVDTMIKEIKNYLPDLHSSMEKLEDKLHSNDFPEALELAYSQIKGISIDYGIMEKTNHVYTIRSSFGWSDVGSWDEIYNLKEKDINGNVTKGNTVMVDTKNCLIINDQKITATVNVEDLLIIDTENGLLICKKGESQNVKEIVDYLKRKGLDQYL